MSENTPPEIYADEITGVLLGYPISKLVFASNSQSSGDGKIIKSNVVTVTLSTQALIIGLAFAQKNIRENHSNLLEFNSESAEKLSAAMQQLAQTSPQAEQKRIVAKKPSKSAK